MFKWHKVFAQGRDNLEDDEHTTHPRAVRTELMIQEVATFVHVNCFQMVNEATAATGMVVATHFYLMT